MVVVSNSSVLINLSIIGHLDLLKKFFGEVIIPQAVWQEVVVDGAGKPGAKEVEHANWIKIEGVENVALVQSLAQYLDDGESETIALATEINTDLVLLDEKDARNTAEIFELDTLGVIGILIWAKRDGLIPSLKEKLNELKKIAKFRISNQLYRRALAEVNEI